MSYEIQPNGRVGVRRPSRSAILTAILLVAVVVFVALALRNNWAAVRADLGKLSIWDLVASGAAAAVALGFAGASWQYILTSMGSPMPIRDSYTVYMAGQLGKYAPGSVWSVVIQTQLGSRSNVPRTTMLASYVIAMMVSLATGGLVGLLILTGDGGASNWGLAVGTAIGAAVLLTLLYEARWLNRISGWASARTGRSLPKIHPSGRTVGPAAALMVGAWAFFGLHAWLLARPLGAGIGFLIPTVGAFSLAFVAGTAAIPLPAGAGIREAVLVLMLSGEIGKPSALTVSLISRLVLLVVEVALAAAFGVHQAARGLRSDGTSDELTPP